MAPTPGTGIITKPSLHSVDETVAKLTGVLRYQRVRILGAPDHSGEATKVGMSMPPTKLLIFGDPKAGICSMLAAPHHRHLDLKTRSR